MSNQYEELSGPNRALVKPWALTTFDGEKLVEGVNAELTFTLDGQVFGTVGVNRMMGEYQGTQDTIIFGDLATTMMVGPPNAQDQENRLLKFLQGELAYLIEEQTLTIGSVETHVLQGLLQESSEDSGD